MPQSKPYFSVIIPLSKINESIIHETLPALQEQTYKNFEVFILPDKKSKHDDKLQQKYPWLQVLPTDLKRKPGDKRDHAAQIAKGDIFAFIDDDAHPLPNWLENAYQVFDKNPLLLALGGPGILPLTANIWEDIFDSVLTSSLGSGAYRYRFTPDKEQFVDDYPSMNLMMKAAIFRIIGGFNNAYWPGEDSKMLNQLKQLQIKSILYHPHVVVYHHRRDNLLGHLKQHKNYGHTRGLFFAQGDQNSRNIMFLVPTLFTLYVLTVAATLVLQPHLNLRSLFIELISIPLILYMALLLWVSAGAFWNKKKWYIFPGTFLIIPVTHLTYGIYFIAGYLKGIGNK